MLTAPLPSAVPDEAGSSRPFLDAPGVGLMNQSLGVPGDLQRTIDSTKYYVLAAVIMLLVTQWSALYAGTELRRIQRCSQKLVGRGATAGRTWCHRSS